MQATPGAGCVFGRAKKVLQRIHCILNLYLVVRFTVFDCITYTCISLYLDCIVLYLMYPLYPDHVFGSAFHCILMYSTCMVSVCISIDGNWVYLTYLKCIRGICMAVASAPRLVVFHCI